MNNVTTILTNNAVVVAVVNGVWVFVLIAFVLPFLLSGLFS